MSSVGSLSDKSLLLSTVQMDDSQQHPSYQRYGLLSTVIYQILFIRAQKQRLNKYRRYYFTTTLEASIFTAGPIVDVTFTDFM